nr:hypothetical protein [Pirellula staleyi]
MMHRFLALATLAACMLLGGKLANSQTMQFPSSQPGVIPAAPAPTTAAPPTTYTPSASPYGAFPTPPASSTPITAAPSFGAPTTAAPFDPYSASGPAAYSYWNTPNTNIPVGTPMSPTGTPYPGTISPPGSGGVFTQPPAPPGAYPYGTPGSPYGQPGVFPPPSGAPNSLFPNGINSGAGWDYSQTVKLIQQLRFRHSYLNADDSDAAVGINDSEIAVSLTFPNFLYSNQPLYMSPAFALHLWDGPANLAADLPGSAYSAYLDFQFQTDPQQQLGAELGFRVGVYSDFETLNSDSLRINGLGLGTLRITPAMQLKLGVMYLDRNDIKLLPAGGILWQPSPQVRFDIFFPQPKLSTYLTSINGYEVWGYLAGEYGGGAWTIQRADATSDSIDINDIRISLGMEWTGTRGVTGYFEAGYVFEREVVYVVDPSDTFDPPDTFMLRAGFSF